MAPQIANPTAYHNLIDGAWVDSVSGDLFENRNPADTDDFLGAFQSSTRADVTRAVEAARSAYDQWRRKRPTNPILSAG
jgi:acyl-CoA reductase-like NAD-dependent aldehyde dehydrogenase